MPYGSNRERDLNGGAAEEDHRDKRSRRMKAIGTMLDDADLVVDAFHPSIGHAEFDGCEDPVAVLPQRAREFHERGKPGAAGPGEPGLQVSPRRSDAASVERPQLLLEQVRVVDAAVEPPDLGET